MINKDFIIYYFIAKVKIRYTSSMELIVLHTPCMLLMDVKKRFLCAPPYGLPVFVFFWGRGGIYIYVSNKIICVHTHFKPKKFARIIYKVCIYIHMHLEKKMNST